MSLNQALLEAGWLVSQIRVAFPDADEEMLASAVESETNLTEQIAIVLRSAEDDRTMGAALKIRIAELEERLGRIEAAQERKRAIAVHAMQEFGIKRISAPEFTANIIPSPCKVIITNEAELPEGYWRQKPPPPPEPDRNLIKSVIQGGGTVPGAVLSNPSYHVTIRRS